jgi:hypothetical protein
VPAEVIEEGCRRSLIRSASAGRTSSCARDQLRIAHEPDAGDQGDRDESDEAELAIGQRDELAELTPPAGR